MPRSRAVTWILRIALVAVALVVVGVAGLWAASARQLGRVHDVPRGFQSAGGSAARGEHFVRAIAACQACHGEDLGGAVMVNAPAFMVLPAPNLTTGRGGVGARLEPADWERAVRHGLGRDGRGLLMMPSDVYAEIRDSDMADAIAYLSALPPVDRDLAPRAVGPAGRAAVAFQPVSLFSALRVDHASVGRSAGAATPGADRGEYLAMTCRGCHGPDLAGLPVGIEPGTPPPPNLTAHPAAPTATWSEADFARLIRSGLRPDGTPVHPLMPWPAFAGLTDDELADLWTYLRSVPQRPPVPPTTT